MRWSERESGTPQSPDTVKAIPCKYSVVIYKICTKVCFFLSITTVFFYYLLVSSQKNAVNLSERHSDFTDIDKKRNFSVTAIARGKLPFIAINQVSLPSRKPSPHLKSAGSSRRPHLRKSRMCRNIWPSPLTSRLSPNTIHLLLVKLERSSGC